jgi:hypothetical protein
MRIESSHVDVDVGWLFTLFDHPDHPVGMAPVFGRKEGIERAPRVSVRSFVCCLSVQLGSG